MTELKKNVLKFIFTLFVTASFVLCYSCSMFTTLSEEEFWSEKKISGYSSSNSEYEYSCVNKLVTLTRYIGSETSVIIPSYIDGMPVQSLAGTFRYCTGLTGITLPSGVTSIGSYTFYNCTGLTGITLPSGVTSIGSYAFYNCSRLTGITLPSGVTSIGSDAFHYCSNLANVKVERTTPPALSGSYVFISTSSSLVISVPLSSLSAYKTAPYWSNYASKMVGYTE
jgi:hypothetical protein